MIARPFFPFFQSHLDLAHHYWKQHLQIGSVVIDATCGNGHDSLVLANLILNEYSGTLYCIDLQTQAIEATTHRLKEALSEPVFKRVSFIQGSHEQLPSISSCHLIVYNLGYLPGGDHSLTTQGPSTLNSLKQGLALLGPGGMVSMTLYPGHEAGFKEKKLLLEYTSSLDPSYYLVCHHQIENRTLAPSLLLIFKKLK
jgi:hypothetical protein